MDTFRAVVFTQGGLGVAISRRIAELPGVTLAGIYVEKPPPRKHTLRERVRRYLKYYGCAGSVRHLGLALASRLLPRPKVQGSPDEQAFRAIAQAAGADFADAPDLHVPEILDRVAAAGADLGLVVGTTILKPALYDTPRLGSINVHQARVPRYRGSSPLFWALYNGEAETGITIHQVAERVDAGEVILETSLPLTYDYDRYGTDYEAFIRDFQASLAQPSVELMVEAVRRIAAGTECRRPQDEATSRRLRKPDITEQRQLRAILRSRYSVAHGPVRRKRRLSVAEPGQNCAAAAPSLDI